MLLAAAGRPPTLRLGDAEDMGDARLAFADGAVQPLAVIVEREMYGHDAGRIGKERHRHHEVDGAVLQPDLLRRHMLDAGDLQPAKGDFPVDAEWCNREVPVPAEVALRLAQHIAIGDRRIAGMIGHVEGLRRLTARAFRYRGP